MNLLGGTVGLYVLFAVLRGEGSLAYAGMARESDRPRAGLYILVPFLSTAAGGIASNWLFGSWAAVGYLVCGCGDAVAEPFGIRFGRHRYRVPSLVRGQASWRSLEGSAAVFVASLAAALVGIGALMSADAGTGRWVLAALAVAATAAVVEAVSHHGLDNLSVQVAASAAAWAMA